MKKRLRLTSFFEGFDASSFARMLIPNTKIKIGNAKRKISEFRLLEPPKITLRYLIKPRIRIPIIVICFNFTSYARIRNDIRSAIIIVSKPTRREERFAETKNMIPKYNAVFLEILPEGRGL